MPRIRTIKPEFWSSPGVAKMSPLARLTFIGMWNWADDTGKGTYNPRELMGFIFPNEEEMTVADFRRLCAEVRLHVAVVFYEVAGRRFYWIPSWKKHQSRHAKTTGSKLPVFEDGNEIDPENLQVIGTVAESRRNSADSNRDSADSARGSAIGTGEQGNRGTEDIHMSETSSDVSTVTSKPSDRFDEFWEAYPRRVGKKTAQARFTAACKRATPETIIAGARRLANDPNLPEKQFIPHPSTWLSRDGWEDEPLPPRNTSTNTPQEPAWRHTPGTRFEDWIDPAAASNPFPTLDAEVIDQQELE